MRHENNFLLYVLGSACMLISGAMLISSVDSTKSNLSANIVSVTTISSQKEFSEVSSLQGTIFFDANANGLFDEGDAPAVSRDVFLWRERPVPYASFWKKTKTDTSGSYSFQDIPKGYYGIRLEEKEGETFLVPENLVQGFSHGVHFIPLEVGSRAMFFTDLNFAIQLDASN